VTQGKGYLLRANNVVDSSDDGAATDFHFIHTGSMAMRGWSTVMIEATAVVPEGRITPQDAVSWVNYSSGSITLAAMLTLVVI
jgi:2,4-dienoyl-CoA reductase-like NADH-dependent reductase (Old Yellow Enzyme family)